MRAKFDALSSDLTALPDPGFWVTQNHVSSPVQYTQVPHIVKNTLDTIPPSEKFESLRVEREKKGLEQRNSSLLEKVCTHIYASPST